MKIGVSSYSFHQAVEAGTLSTYDIVDTAARMGFASIDFAVLLGDDSLEEMCVRLGRQARDAGLDVANYAVAADFLNNDLDAEVARVQGEVENAVRLGARTFRHDGAWGLPKDGSARTFQQALPRIAEGCRRVTEYAAARGIRTMVENHGTFLQDADRVEMLINTVNCDNFGWLCDMGNFLCADENPAVSYGKAAPYAFYAHAKDFILKSGNEPNPGDCFFQTRAGNYLRGTIIGHGVVPVKQCLQILKNNGYDGFIGVEFEGVEDCILGISVGLANLRRFVKEVYGE